MPTLKQRATEALASARRRSGLLDHLLSMLRHYGVAKGNVQAGAVTFFAFLSFFPILALAFFGVGQVASIFPEAQDTLETAIESLFPGLVGDGEGQISLVLFQQYANTVGLIGLAGVLYSGLGWLSGMREALLVMFAMPPQSRPNFVVGKARDLVSLVLVGVTLMVAIALSTVVTTLSGTVLGWFGALVPGVVLHLLVKGIGSVLAIAANVVLFLALFKLLAKPDVPNRALLHGALVGALGFEVLKQLATTLMAITREQPAFHALGVALILVVWINYFSRVTMYSAAWAYTSPVAVAARATAEQEHAMEREDVAPEAGGVGAVRGGHPSAGDWPAAGPVARVGRHRRPDPRRSQGQRRARGLVAAGAVAAVFAGVVVRRRQR